MNNNSLILVGCVVIVALVAVTAMVTQQTNNPVLENNNVGYTTYLNAEYDFVPNNLFQGVDGSLYLTNKQGIVLGYTDSQKHLGESFDVYMHMPRSPPTNRAGLVHTTTTQATITLFEDEKGTYGVVKQGQSSWVLPLTPHADEEKNSVGTAYYPPWFFN